MKIKRMFICFGLSFLLMFATHLLGDVFNFNNSNWYMLVRTIAVGPFIAMGFQRLGDLIPQKNTRLTILSMIVRAYGVFLAVGLFVVAMVQLFGS